MKFPKPEPIKRVKARAKRQGAKARRACVAAVWDRDGHRCRRCHRPVWPVGKLEGWSGRYCEGWEDWAGHVNEITPKSLMGDPTDPNNCELICRACHFSGPSGAHAPTPARAA